MNNFIFSLNATIPIFLIILLGYLLKAPRLFTKEFVQVANKYVFVVALPVLLFQDISTSNIRSSFDPKFVIFCMLVTTIIFGGIYLISSRFIKDKPVLGAFVQASARGSAAVLGIAFVQNIYGNSAMAPLMIVASVPLYNIYSVIVLTLCSRDQSLHKSAVKTAFINILKNPIIIGILAGILFSFCGLTLPAIPSKIVSMISNTATPIALLVVGASFDGTKAIKKIKPTIIATFIKLIALPAIFFPFAITLGFRDSQLVALLVMLGAPTTVTCYIMAKSMGNDDVLSSSIVVLATLVSSITLTAWIFILKALHLI